jgi:hypothetical protein
MKRASRVDGKRPLSHRMGETEGKLKDRHREILLRHEGLAPVRLSIGLETGSASFAADEFLPDVGSIALSLRAL